MYYNSLVLCFGPSLYALHFNGSVTNNFTSVISEQALLKQDLVLTSQIKVKYCWFWNNINSWFTDNLLIFITIIITWQKTGLRLTFTRQTFLANNIRWTTSWYFTTRLVLPLDCSVFIIIILRIYCSNLSKSSETY